MYVLGRIVLYHTTYIYIYRPTVHPVYFALPLITILCVYYTNQLILNACEHNQYRLSKCLDRYNVCVSVERQRLQGAVSTKAYEHMGCNTILIHV